MRSAHCLGHEVVLVVLFSLCYQVLSLLLHSVAMSVGEVVLEDLLLLVAHFVVLLLAHLLLPVICVQELFFLHCSIITLLAIQLHHLLLHKFECMAFLFQQVLGLLLLRLHAQIRLR